MDNLERLAARQACDMLGKVQLDIDDRVRAIRANERAPTVEDLIEVHRSVVAAYQWVASLADSRR